jgi:hypothetical protein
MGPLFKFGELSIAALWGLVMTGEGRTRGDRLRLTNASITFDDMTPILQDNDKLGFHIARAMHEAKLFSQRTSTTRTWSLYTKLLIEYMQKYSRGYIHEVVDETKE